MTPPSPFDHEDSLPRVPLPSLADSARRFLEWCNPLLTDDERTATRAAVADFLRPDGPAPILQAALERFDATPGVRSWLDRFWPSRYLGRRDRIALNANFFFLFNDPPEPETQVRRAAGLIAGALAYKRRIDDGTLAPVAVRGQAQSMEQNKYLFSTTRIPGAYQDTVRAPYGDEWPGPSPFRHIVVFHHGHAFRMDVVGPDGPAHSLDDIEEGLEDVLKAATNPAPTDTSIGRLTTKARAEWAASRQRLAALDPANAAALETIETALFCVCLDDAAPADTLAACDLLLHGDSGNRWFDKAVSFVVFADGTAGINVEHCDLDGTTILHFVDAIAAATAEDHAAAAGAVSQGLPAIDAVDVVLDPDLRADIQAAGDAFADFAAANATTRVALPGFGSDRIKELGFSPDAFVQMSYQLAHQRTKGLVGATYESIATRQFQNGRTEAMRVVTPEAVEFVAAMDDPSATPDDRRAALRAATEAHGARARACQRGDAPEQHLWELLLVQEREGEALGGAAREPMALFRSPGWKVMRDDFLSTSSAPSLNIQHFGFGATASRCIGVAYLLLPDKLHLYLSTPKAVAEPMHRFGAEVAKALTEMETLVTSEA